MSGHELAKQRIWENVPGRGQQGKALELSASMLPTGTSAFMWLQWVGMGCKGVGIRGKMALEGEGWKDS